MGLFYIQQPQQDLAAMPSFSEDEAAAILVGAKHNKSLGDTTTSLVDLYNRGLVFGDQTAKDTFYDQVQIDLGDELILVCDCCNSVYQYFASSRSLHLFEGPGCGASDVAFAV